MMKENYERSLSDLSHSNLFGYWSFVLRHFDRSNYGPTIICVLRKMDYVISPLRPTSLARGPDK
jgi:hypothetical protein